MGVSPGKAGNGQARPGAQTPAAFIHKDAASPAQGLRPMFAPLQQAPTAGPTLPALSRAHGLSGVPRRETSRLGEPAKATGRSVVDELWNTPGAMGLADEAPQSGAGARQKKMLVGGGVILLVAIVWACWPSSDKAAYRPTPQAAQAAPAEAQPVPQPDRGPGTAPVTPNGTLAPAVNPGAVPAYIGASPARPGGRTEPGPAMPDENHGQAPAMSPEPAPDGDAHPAATTMPAQDIAPSKPTAGAEPAKPLERQYRPCPSGIRLTGIVQQAGRKVACINGKFRDVGDRVCGATVVEIKDLSVEMEQDGQRFLVGFGSPTDAASDDEAPADEDKSSSQDTPKANKPDPDTQPADPPQPPTKKKHKSKPADE